MNGLIEKPTATPQLGYFISYLAAMAVISGFLFGYDTGVVSSAMLYIPEYQNMRPMNLFWKELIVSITPGMAAIGSLLGGPSSERFGRKRVIIASCLLFLMGALLCCGAWEKSSLLCGRIILGIATGFSSMVVPIYIGEAAPSNVRGRLVGEFQLAITFGFLAACLISGAFSYIDPSNIGWRLMLGFAAIPAAIQFLGFLFLPESPRYLFEKAYKDEAKKVLLRIYNGNEEWTAYEMAEIERVCKEKGDAVQHVGGTAIIVRILRTSHVRKALFIGCGIQIFQQFSGVNTIMYYTGTIIKSAGVKDNHNTIWVSSAIYGVNFLATFIPIYFIEKLGRRKLFLISMFGVFLALAVMGTAFVMINQDSVKTYSNYSFLITNSSNDVFEKCASSSNCDDCVLNENCGFCYSSQLPKGYCLPPDPVDSDYSIIGSCSKYNKTDEYEFQLDYCKTKYTPLPIVIMVFYMIFFAVGYAPLPWVINAEIYPLWARSIGCSLSTFFNWFCNLIVSITFLSLSEAVTKYGAFWIYGGITLIAIVFVFIFLPETRGIPIEETELLFMSKNQRETNIRIKALPTAADGTRLRRIQPLDRDERRTAEWNAEDSL